MDRAVPRLVMMVAPLALALLLGVLAPAADARKSIKKSIWGPVRVNGVSQFPIYRDLGVGIYQIGVVWDQTAPTRPSNPTDPNDPAYHWQAEVDDAVREARRYGIRVALPPWRPALGTRCLGREKRRRPPAALGTAAAERLR